MSEQPIDKSRALLETTTRTIPSYYLYPDKHDMLGIVPDGPAWGHLTITNEVKNTVPCPMRKCELETYDKQARERWGDSRRVFWIRDEGDLLVAALAHVNGQQVTERQFMASTTYEEAQEVPGWAWDFDGGIEQG